MLKCSYESKWESFGFFLNRKKTFDNYTEILCTHTHLHTHQSILFNQKQNNTGSLYFCFFFFDYLDKIFFLFLFSGKNTFRVCNLIIYFFLIKNFQNSCNVMKIRFLCVHVCVRQLDIKFYYFLFLFQCFFFFVRKIFKYIINEWVNRNKQIKKNSRIHLRSR